jgi:hypothetical protein
VDASYPVKARISGVLRGLLRDGVPVKQGDRIADIDPRGDTDDLNHISDKSRRVAEGVHEALLGLIAEMERRRPKGGKKSRSPASKKKAAPSPKRRKPAAKSGASARKKSAAKGGSAEKTASKTKAKKTAKSTPKKTAGGARRSAKS